MVWIEGTRTCNVRRCRKITLHTLTCELWIILGAGCRHRRRRHQPTKIIYLYFSILLLFISFSIFLLSCLHTYLGRLSRARARVHVRRSFVPIAFVFTRFRIGNVTIFLCAVIVHVDVGVSLRRRRSQPHLFVCARIFFFICSFVRALISSASFFHSIICVVWTRARR